MALPRFQQPINPNPIAALQGLNPQTTANPAQTTIAPGTQPIPNPMVANQQPTMKLPEQISPLPLNTEQQQQYRNQFLPLGMEYLQQGFPSFAPIRQQATTQFEKSIPSLANRFTQLGGSGALRGSEFASQLGSARSQLEENLAAQETQYNALQAQQKQNLGAQLLNAGLAPQYDYLQQAPDFFQNLAGGAGASLPKVLELLSNLGGKFFGGAAKTGTEALAKAGGEVAGEAVKGAVKGAGGKIAKEAGKALATGTAAGVTGKTIERFVNSGIAPKDLIKNTSTAALGATIAPAAAVAGTAGAKAGTAGIAAKTGLAAAAPWLLPAALLGTVIALPFAVEAFSDWISGEKDTHGWFWD